MNRKCESVKELYDTFCSCEVNIPSLDVIKSVPGNAKILKEFCTAKMGDKLNACQKKKVVQSVSAVIQRNIPIKCSDPGMFLSLVQLVIIDLKRQCWIWVLLMSCLILFIII